MSKENFKTRYLVMVFIFILVSYVFYSSPRDFEKTLECVYFQLGEENVENTKKLNIKFEGDYLRRIFGGDKFRGNIIVGNNKIEFVELNFHKSSKQVIFGLVESEQEYDNYGVIYTNGNLKKFSIIILQGEEEYGSWSRKNGFMISGPCNTREEALEIANGMMKVYLMDDTLK